MSDRILEFYNRVLAKTATDFALSTADTLNRHIRPSEIVLLNINGRTPYPNIYAPTLVVTLQSLGYNPSLHPVKMEDTLSGCPRREDVGRKPVVLVDIHLSTRAEEMLSYVNKLYEPESRTFYASPVPPTATVWEYVTGRMLNLNEMEA